MLCKATEKSSNGIQREIYWTDIGTMEQSHCLEENDEKICSRIQIKYKNAQCIILESTTQITEQGKKNLCKKDYMLACPNHKK